MAERRFLTSYLFEWVFNDHVKSDKMNLGFMKSSKAVENVHLCL